MDYLYACLTQNSPPFGSIYYYAYRRCSEDIIKTLYALDQLKYQWFKASELYSKSFVSLQKLQWWQQALINLEAHRDHPLLDILYQHFELNELCKLLTHDLEYALETLAEGRNYQDMLDLSESFLGIAILKARLLGFEELHHTKTLNHLSELSRHIIMIGKHFSRNIILDNLLTPQIDKDTFHKVAHKLVQHIQKLKAQSGLTSAQIKQIKPIILLNKQQELCTKKFIQKVNSPFIEGVHISPFSLLFSTLFASKL